jgi:lipopolysaccharide export system permease protein
VLTFLIGEFVAPSAERMAQQLRLRAMSSVVGQEFRTGLWVKDEQTFVNVSEVSPDTSLRGVRIYQFDNRNQLLSISEAASGTFVAPDHWRLLDVVSTEFSGDKTNVSYADQVMWKSALNPDVLTVLMVDPGRMSLINLYSYIRHLTENQQRTHSYEIAMWKKLIYPVAALVMMILALPFGYLHDRMGTASLKLFFGVMLGVAFYMMNGLFSSLGVINSWTPFVAALTPSALFLLAAGIMTWWVERR